MLHVQDMTLPHNCHFGRQPGGRHSSSVSEKAYALGCPLFSPASAEQIQLTGIAANLSIYCTATSEHLGRGAVWAVVQFGQWCGTPSHKRHVPTWQCPLSKKACANLAIPWHPEEGLENPTTNANTLACMHDHTRSHSQMCP